MKRARRIARPQAPPAESALSPAAGTPEPPPTVPPPPAKAPGAGAPPAPKVEQRLNGLKIPPILLEGDEAEAPVRKERALKYFVGGSVGSVLEPETVELPEAYGTGRLLLAARDAHCLYAHWDLTMDQQRRFNAAAVDRRLVLRVYVEGRGPLPATELTVHPDSKHWFVHLDCPGVTCVAELGYYQTESVWRMVARSEPARVPTDRPAVATEVRFMVFDAKGPGSHVSLEPAPKVQHGPAIPRPSVPVLGEAATPAAAALPRPVSPSGWTPGQEKLMGEMLATIVRQGSGLSSLQVIELARRQVAAEQPGLIPNPPNFPEAPAEAIFSPTPPGPEEAPFSPAGGAMPGPGGFWFNINAELVIYGATEPDATVRLGGQLVQLRPDGTFSFRFSLPDGQHSLSVSAESSSGETRAAELWFGRDTAYYGEVGAHPQDPALKPPSPDHLA